MRNYDYDAAQTIVVPDGAGNNNFLSGMLASACQSKGLDASAVMALCNGRNGGLGILELMKLLLLSLLQPCLAETETDCLEAITTTVPKDRC